ncbi:hypothetical protein VTK56DRAFT_4669 [Thermocarpiscus australiensis]
MRSIIGGRPCNTLPCSCLGSRFRPRRSETLMFGDIWQRRKQGLPRRTSSYADNVQLLRRPAEDAKRDAGQWAALSGDADPAADTAESELAEEEVNGEATYPCEDTGSATRLIDVLRHTMAGQQVTADSKEISDMVQRLHGFQLAALGSPDELQATTVLERGPRTLGGPGGPSLG